MKKILGIGFLVVVAASAMAIPARRDGFVRTDANGNTITVFAHGDETFHYFTDAEGRWLDAETLLPMSDEAKAETEKRGIARKQARRVQTAGVSRLLAPRGAVILVSYKDQAFASTNAEMTDWAMGDNYSYRGATGSIRRYFLDQSWGQYDMQIDVIGPVTVSRNGSYYGANDYQGNDKHPDELVVEACKLAHDDYGVDFSQYDSNNDGYVDWVVILYAGYGEADGAPATTIWPHQWELSYTNMEFKLDGKTVDHYCCLNELDYTTQRRNGIGTFCHEFGHVMGLPDLYATNYATHHTLADWDIMDYGAYLNNGNTPPAYSAYERWYMGWMTPTLVNEACSVEMPVLNDCKAACLLTEDGSNVTNILNPDPATFYLLETRKKEGWDKYIPGEGMLVTKIQFDAGKWEGNTVNNTARAMGIDILEAKSNTGKFGKATDAYPKGADEFTEVTKYQVTRIEFEDDVVSFNVNGGGKRLIVGKDSVPQDEKALKYFEYGTVVIERNGKKYDIVGRLIAQ